MLYNWTYFASLKCSSNVNFTLCLRVLKIWSYLWQKAAFKKVLATKRRWSYRDLSVWKVNMTEKWWKLDSVKGKRFQDRSNYLGPCFVWSGYQTERHFYLQMFICNGIKTCINIKLDFFPKYTVDFHNNFNLITPKSLLKKYPFSFDC